MKILYLLPFLATLTHCLDVCDNSTGLLDYYASELEGEDTTLINHDYHIGNYCRCAGEPVPTVLFVPHHIDEDIVSPYLSKNYVVVKRCKGTCTSTGNVGQICYPNDRSNVIKRNFSVQVKTGHSYDTRSFEIEEHVGTSCGCHCPLTEDVCVNQGKRFAPKACKCICKNLRDKMKCKERSDYWDEDSCTCFPRKLLKGAQTAVLVAFVIIVVIAVILIGLLLWDRRKLKRIIVTQRRSADNGPDQALMNEQKL